MADITMCNGNYCELRETCYRYSAPKSEFRQSYFIKEPNNTSYDCDYFWSNGKDSLKCKLNGVKRDGEICNLDYCTYPKCIQDKYCPKCHQIDGIHKMGCETRKITIVQTK